MAKDTESAQESSEVRIKDRRRFSSTGEPLETAEEPKTDAGTSSEKSASAAGTEGTGKTEASASTGQSASAESGKAAQAESPISESAQAPPLPPASFEMLVISLGMQAQMELGSEIPKEGSPPNLDIARHTIDLLGVLQEKTKGNLTLDEARVLENTLTELRFRYVQKVGEINQKAKPSS